MYFLDLLDEDLGLILLSHVNLCSCECFCRFVNVYVLTFAAVNVFVVLLMFVC